MEGPNGDLLHPQNPIEERIPIFSRMGNLIKILSWGLIHCDTRGDLLTDTVDSKVKTGKSLPKLKMTPRGEAEGKGFPYLIKRKGEFGDLIHYLISINFPKI